MVSFGEWIASKTWQEIDGVASPSTQVQILHSILEQGMERCFEMKTRKKKTTEPVWMTDEIRTLIRKRRRLYRRVKRKEKWMEIKAIVAAKVSERKKGHGQYVKDKFAAEKDSGNFYRSVNSIMKGCEQEAWNVRALYPDQTDQDISEIMAEYFNKISEEYRPLQNSDIPTTHDTHLPIITEEQVRRRLIKMSKPTSQVPGDIPPTLYKHYANYLAVPVTKIFNNIARTFEWPELWGVEYVTIIPKCPSPETVDQCRNISCTNFLSKVIEAVVLEWARSEVKLSANQYGGEPGCSPSHFLVQMNDYIASTLEDNKAGIVLTSMDFSKAFNRLSHQSCLKQIQLKGASNQIIKLIASFLKGRRCRSALAKQGRH